METQKRILILTLVLSMGSPALAQVRAPANINGGMILAQATPAPAEAAPAPTAAAPAAEAADDEDDVAGEVGPAPNFIGSATAGYRHTDDDIDGFKFGEYRDLDSGVLLGTELMYFRPSGYYGYFAADALIQDDRAVEYRGGRWGGHRYALYGSTLIHDYADRFDRTFYTTGVGTDTVSYEPTDYNPAYTPPSSVANARTAGFNIPRDPLQWREAGFKKTVDTFGGSYLYKSAEHPWYASLNAEHRIIKGVQPLSSRTGVANTVVSTSSTNSVELPAPLDGKSTTVGASAGLSNEYYTVELNTQLTKYESKYDYLTHRDPFVTYRTGDPTHTYSETVSLTPDSDATTFGVKAVAKKLWLDSTLALNVSRQMIRSDIPLRNTIAASTNTTGTYADVTLGLSSESYNGKVDYDNASLIWSALPMENLSLTAAARYTNKKNTSDVITYTEGANSISNHLFGYEKNSFSLGAGYQLPMDTKLSGSVSRTVTLRSNLSPEEDFSNSPKNIDRNADVTLRNSTLDTLGVALKLSYLDREEDFVAPDAAAARVKNYRRTYLAGKTRKAATLSLDYSPISDLTTTAEYTYARVDFKDIPYGVKENAFDEYYFDVSYELPTWFKITGFYSFSKMRDTGLFHVGANPGTDNGTTDYDWNLDLESMNYYYGGVVEVPVIEDKVDLSVGYVHMRDDGKAEFLASNATADAALTDIDDHNDYVKDELSAKVTYKPIERLETSLAYVHQRLTADDLRWSQFTTTTTTNRIVSSGAGSDYNYDVNLIYATATYAF